MVGFLYIYMLMRGPSVVMNTTPSLRCLRITLVTAASENASDAAKES